jgi:arylsulfatase A-like enzyme
MSRRPHILLFNPDQWRGDVLGHVGNPGARTPRLDRWVGEDAVSFRWSFCQNPVCTPSRCSFLTGWYPHVRGHRTMFHMLREQEGEANLLKLLKEQGYFVWWAGKNDVVPGQGGYAQHCSEKVHLSRADWQRWGLTPRPDPHSVADWRGSPVGDRYYSFYAGRLDKGEEPIYADRDWGLVLRTIEFIESYDGDQPLCLYLPLGFPHPPYGVEEPYYSAIARDDVPPRVPTPDWSSKPSLLRGIWEGQGMQSWSEERLRELRSTYYGMCMRVDDQFGRVIDALERRGWYDDTAIFFFSDHGDLTGDYGLVEKTQNTFEDCLVNVPFIVKPPAGIRCTPRVSQGLVELIDLPATVFDLLDLDPGYDHFGRSLLPLLAEEHVEHRDAVYSEGGRRYGETQAMELESTALLEDPSVSHYWPRMAVQQSDDGPFHTKATMCRTRSAKYVRRLYESDEFYDLAADPVELVNQIDNPAYRDAILEHKDRLLTWYQETCDVVPRDPDSRR